jgi:NAD(P)-dependent dehydrogenase (short-subunit alcohol dehydrogenase family)
VAIVYVAIQEASRHMGKGGRIINIGSCVAERMTNPNR